ncbi:hypothetical protein GALL_533100 [mine drainage metagenome]|uniref:Uncharacterized protein n=1 Tax=mine drainage metagenome TaxID=410659 RepID=A0A1J5PBG3_9ZZZZ
MLVDQCCSRVACSEHVVDGGKLFEIQRHRGRDILGLGPRRSHAHGDELSDMSHLAGRKNRLLGYLEAGQAGYSADRLDPAQICGREDDIAVPLGHVDIPYPGMRQRAADKGNILQACDPDIGHVLAAPAHEAIVFLAKQTRTHPLPAASGCVRGEMAFNVRHQWPSPLEFAAGGYAATARGKIGAIASWRTPARKQNAGCNRLSATTSVFSLSRKM